MKKILPGILHKDKYTDAFVGELEAYLLDTIFGPLFEILREANVSTNRKDQEIGKTPQIKNAEEPRWTIFPAELRSLRLKRAEMPQIASEDREALTAYLATRSIESEEGLIGPASLRPTQEGYWPDKVVAAKNHAGADRPILISSDGFIVDGHHQWFSAFQSAPDKPIAAVQFDALIGPLLDAVVCFPGVTFKNARSSDAVLATALKENRIWYADGKFTGDFTAAISKRLRALGATWNGVERSFALPLDRLPMDLRVAVAESEEASSALHKQVVTTLDNMADAIPLAPTGLQYQKAVDNVTNDLQKQFVRTVPALESISVPVVITKEMRAAISSELTNNLALYIKKFAAEEIPELRGLVEQNAFAGGRTPQLARIIEARWGIGKRKAKFLADQETSLLVSKYREQTYRRIGVRNYVWSSAHDERVRPLHRELNGRTFSFDSPPRSGTKGEHQNPGEPFGCRCVALPILDLPGVSVLP